MLTAGMQGSTMSTDRIVLQVVSLLLVLAQGAGAASPHLGRRDMLHLLFEAMPVLEAPLLALVLQTLEALTCYPALLQPLQVGSPLAFACLP